MKYEGLVTYTKPEDSSEDEISRHHHFEIKVDGEVVAAAEVQYFSSPIPFYQISDAYTEYEHQGKGYGTAIMEKIEAFLLERGKPGILVDNSVLTQEMDEAKTGVNSFYETRGWRYINDIHMVFNLPDDIDPDVFAGYEMRGADVS
jgi:GNAT superfamily N-acetyltransferase